MVVHFDVVFLRRVVCDVVAWEIQVEELGLAVFCGYPMGLLVARTWWGSKYDPIIRRYFCRLLPKHSPPPPPSSLLPEQQLMVVLGGALFCCKPWPALSWTWSLMWDLEKSNPLFLSLFPKSVYRICISLWPLFLISWIRLNRGMTVDYVMRPYLWDGCLPQLDSV